MNPRAGSVRVSGEVARGEPARELSHAEIQTRDRRARGIGPLAHPDPTLTVEALQRAAGFDSPWSLGIEIGISGSTMKEAMERGLSIWVADRCAVHFGFHPASVWGDAWWDASRRLETPEQLSLEVAS